MSWLSLGSVSVSVSLCVQVKSNTLRADEQIKLNAIRTLRDFADTFKQKRKQVTKDKDDSKGASTSQLSSGSESNIGDSELGGAPPKLQRQLSNNDGNPQANPEQTVNGRGGGGGGGGGGGTEQTARERSDNAVPVGGAGVTNGHHHSKAMPTDRVSHSKPEDGRQQPSSGVGESIQPHLRTHSESTAAGSTQHSEIPGKSPTAPSATHPTPSTSVVNGGGASEGDEKRSYAATVSSSKPPKYPSHVTPASKVPPGPQQVVNMVFVTKGPQSTPSLLYNATGLLDDTNSSPALLSAESAPAYVGGATGGNGGLEASSTSSLGQDSYFPEKGPTDRPSERDKSSDGIAERQAGGNGKKRGARGKKQLKLDFQELATGNVVKCTLNTNTGQVDFRFSLEYDKPGAIFKQLVRHTYIDLI